ncbi:MAG TPA: lipoyl domain-containing protein [Candidatus Sulfotelmatobacter sp.]|nr:lipoyl domain-containing protein [Candidatus Sulfotelmatobacter sp.]
MAETVPVVLPKWGMNMVEATLVEWKKSIGDRVREGEAIASVMTDKVEAEVVAPVSGVLTDILVLPDQDATVGATLARIQKDP